MRILVTGLRGQLVRSLIESAEGRSGIELIPIGRPELDLEVPGTAAEAIRKAVPQLVINAGAYTDVDGAEEQPQRALRINGEAAGEVAAAAAEIGAPVIQISTDYVFDGAFARPYREDAPVRPINSYGRTKLAGEEAVRSSNPSHVILRTSWVYSPFGRNFVKTMFEAANERDELKVVSDRRGSPTSALDLADALLRIAAPLERGGHPGLGETYHLCGSGEASWYELAEEVMAARAALGLRAAKLVPVSASDWPMRAIRPPNSVLDSAKFDRDFGFRLPDWRRSVADTVQRLAGAANG